MICNFFLGSQFSVPCTGYQTSKSGKFLLILTKQTKPRQYIQYYSFVEWKTLLCKKPTNTFLIWSSGRNTWAHLTLNKHTFTGNQENQSFTVNELNSSKVFTTNWIVIFLQNWLSGIRVLETLTAIQPFLFIFPSIYK